MRLQGPLLAAALGGVVAYLATQTFPKPRNFVKVTDNLYSLTEVWHLLPFLPGMPVTVNLVRHSGNWTLIDAGVPTSGALQPLAERLVAAVQATIPAGDVLAAIVLTHGHFDHVGAVPLLMAAYPDTPVVMHPAEEPFLVGDRRYAAKDSLYARCLRWTGLESEEGPVPAPRARLLDLSVPDLREYGLSDLRWVATPGHTPGHFSLLHTPSRILLAADAISLIKPSLSLSSSSDANDPRVVTTYQPVASLPGITLRGRPNFICPENCDDKQIRKSFCLLAAEGLDYDVLLAAHDSAAARGGGWAKADVQAYARTMPECQ
ncbi:hypothetical protein CHLNCDRAFT_138441 [Chlorella variabilis]|uniref:Metallo-beta-lactamase domain-containing protein n=1 Tax=Chlorella variabilis TaxID=554065 RepID=E1ZN23_CHLVA|nr:hypothetical protein CHLNCDRAFT_138441 [Chlorella variabilis]EFN52795.1 hypothetical protein CHLNCDRAFT_138441 [Chlorella variabilis]|eukprot:XP_005844897.1 hypothetical protein CHLNCDRAFT_138441 [Chlorella variabilis]